MSVALRQARLIKEAYQQAPAPEKPASVVESAKELVQWVEAERAKAWDETERDRMVKEHAAALAEAESHRARADAAVAERDAARAERDDLQSELSALRAELAARDTLPMLLRSALPEPQQTAVHIDLAGVNARLDGIAGRLDGIAGRLDQPAAPAKP